MPELREVFEMTTKQVEPDSDVWEQQEKRQTRARRNRRFGGYAVAAGLVAVTVVLGFRLLDLSEREGEGGIGRTVDRRQATHTLAQLRGRVWFEESGSRLLSIGLDGSYALDGSGLLDTDPEDVGTVDIDGDGLIRFVSGEASRECVPGNAWVWRSAEIVGANLLRVAEADASCSVGVQGSSTWGLVGSRSAVSAPVPGPDEAEGRPVAEADLVGFWVNQTGPGLFRYSADGTFAGYLPENLEREPILAGTWEVRGRGERIRLSYQSTTIPGCTLGDVTVMEAELIGLDVGVALRTKVLRSCGDILPPPVQVRVSPR